MTLAKGQTFAAALREALQHAGLPTDPKEIVGRLYRFGCEHGSHHQILCGTICGIEVSDEGGLELHVTNPRFWGAPLISIMYGEASHRWVARVEAPPTERSDEEWERMSPKEAEHAIAADIALEFFEGEFNLL